MALAASLLAAPAAEAAGTVKAAAAGRQHSVNVSGRASGGARRDAAEPTQTKPVRSSWPVVAHARLALSGLKPGRSLPVTPPGGSTGAAVVHVGPAPAKALAKQWPAIAAPAPATVDVKVLDHTQVRRVGGIGVGAQLTRRDGRGTPGPVNLTFDYSGFRNAYGGNFAARLRVVALPACALTKPKAKGCSPAAARQLPVSNNLAKGTITATVPVDGDPRPKVSLYQPGGRGTTAFQPSVMTAAATSGSTVYTLASGSSSDAGDYRASVLSPSGSWNVSVGSGAFTYSLPVDIPKPPAGVAPELSLQYNSQSVDGRTSATNNQASPLGMGWDLSVGYIERRYRNCADDGLTHIGDLCWDSPNSGKEPDGAVYVINLNGHNTQLIQDNTGTGSYHLQDDPGWRVQHLTGGHGADDEYWVVSTQDGMRYYFGWGRSERTSSATDSVLTVPVVGNDTGEPCHGQFPEPCTQAWRWMVDRVVDPDETENAYFYDKQVNHYRSVANTDKARAYDAAAYLTRIEYGWAAQIPGAQLPAKVEISHVGRCVERMSYADPLKDEPPACPALSTNPSSYPDVPTDLLCDGSASDDYCAGKTYYPTFFSTDMYWDIKTFVRDNDSSAWDPAMQYQMKYGLPNPSGDVGSMLWLDYVERKGYGDGADITLPTINFNGEWLDNQVGSSLLNFRRVNQVHGDLGSFVNVTYGQPDACDINNPPSESDDHQDCFKQQWTPEGSSTQSTGWFKKYVVTKVEVDPGVGKGAGDDGDPVMTTTYDYVGTPAWAFPNDPLVPDSDESWSDWRGYQQVEVHTGTKSNSAGTYYWLYRGLDGDRTSKTDSSQARSVQVTDGEGTHYTDSAWLSGKIIETSQRDGSENSHQRVWQDYWVYDTAQYDGLPDARFVRNSKTTTDELTSSGWREHVVNNEFDNTSTTSTVYGLPLRTNDWGQTGVDDNRCTTYGRAYNTDYFPNSQVQRWMVLQDEVRHYDADCASRDASNQDSYTYTLYDNATDVASDKPTDGNPTLVRSYSDATHYRDVTYTYDQAGRVTGTTDGREHTTTTSYNPPTSWPVNGVEVTTPDPDGSGPGTALRTTTWYSRLWGEAYKVWDESNNQTTRILLDSVGRISKVWRPTEVASYPDSNWSDAYDYTIDTATNSDGVPNLVTGAPRITSKQLQSGSTYTASYTYIDGLGRTREVQQPAPGGTGRTVVSTRYDTSGNTTGTSAAFYNADAAGSGMVNPTVADLPSYTDLLIDYAGRTTGTQILVKGDAQAQGRTFTEYQGDHTTTVPAVGERTDTYTDVFGQITKVVEHGPSSNYTTTYGYTRSGQLSQITDAKGNITRYTYNWLGERTSTTDPDTGTSSTFYDGNGNPVSTTDATNATITTEYDYLNRPTKVSQGTTTLTSNTYDTAAGGKGKLASSTSYAGGFAYTTGVTGYDARGRVQGRTYTVPDDGSGLGGSYTFRYGYDAADHTTSVTYPDAGGLAGETVTTGYDNLGYLDTLSSPLATYVGSTGFDTLGRLSSRTYGTTGTTGTTATRSYSYEDANGTGWLSNVTTTTSTKGAVQNDDYAHDAGGQITGINDKVLGQRQCFTYDELDRLTRAYTTETATGCDGAFSPDLSNTALDPYQLDYTYDGIGNLQKETRTTATGSTVRDYVYPGYSADQSTYTAGAQWPHAVTGINVTGQASPDTYSYDNAGRAQHRTVAGVTSDLAWNALNQLTQYTSHTTGGDKTTKYVYGPDGSLLERISPTESVLYLGSEEIHRSGTPTTLAATRYYQAGATTVAMRVSTGSGTGRLSWLISDLQASTQLTVDTATGTATRRRYLPFGAQRGTTGLDAGSDRGFLGKTEDDSTGLSILDARPYDPVLGRFLSADPLTAPYDPTTFNAYSYADNNPVNVSDPSGLFGVSDLLDAGKAALNAGGKAFAASFVGAVDVGGHAVGNTLLLMDPVVRAVAPESVMGTPSDPTAIGIGWEWATGTGPGHRDLSKGDRFTQSLQQHSNVQVAREKIAAKVLSGEYHSGSKGTQNYSLGEGGGIESLKKLYSDFTSNMSGAFLGSYTLKYTVGKIDKRDNSVTVTFQVKNRSTINSAVHTSPSLGGYSNWWDVNIAKPLNSAFGTSGVMSLKTQTITWTETFSLSSPSYSSGGSSGGSYGGSSGGGASTVAVAAAAGAAALAVLFGIF
ncbi:RHS repeat-associated core domain-containing protein [Streptomyces sp. NPDC028635]|uniref:RHS repeat-associated core domain-containing protein n=1 Tax=Streptomyces sp. NPDC028635 TaxID=3154800 RepID=UPI00340945DD